MFPSACFIYNIIFGHILPEVYNYSNRRASRSIMSYIHTVTSRETLLGFINGSRSSYRSAIRSYNKYTVTLLAMAESARIELMTVKSTGLRERAENPRPKVIKHRVQNPRRVTKTPSKGIQ